MPATGGITHMVHIKDVKYVLPADNVIAKLPNYDTFGRKLPSDWTLLKYLTCNGT